MAIHQKTIEGAGNIKLLLAGLILSDQVCKKLMPLLNEEHFVAPHVQTIIKALIDHFEGFGKAPGTAINDVLEHSTRGMSDKDLDMIVGLLKDIQEQYEAATLPIEYIITSSEKYLQKLSLRFLAEKVLDATEHNDLEDASLLVSNFKQPSLITTGDLSLLTQPDAVEKAFDPEKNANLFSLKGALGEMTNNDLIRTGFVALVAPEKRGKCLAGSECVLLADGSYVPIKQVVRSKAKSIMAFDEQSGKFVPSDITEHYQNGVKQVWRITTKTGRSVVTTLRHPFLTIDGWKELRELSVGAFIASPKRLDVFGSESMPEHVVRLLAYFLAEGCLSSGVPLFSNTDPDMKQDFERCCQAMDCSVGWRKAANGRDGEVRNSEANRGRHNTNYVRDMLRHHGLWGKKCHETSIPGAVFRLPRHQLSLFLRLMYTCDGWITREGKEIGFAVANQVMARQMQHLLTRFGIVSVMRHKPNAKRGSWPVSIHGMDYIRLFMQEIGFVYGKQEKAVAVVENCSRKSKSFLDKLPYPLAERFLADFRDEWERQYDGEVMVPSFYRLYGNKMGAIRQQIKKKCPLMKVSFDFAKGSATYSRYWGTDILWDEIKSIKLVGDEPTFDLTVRDHHNFVAENMLVHNSWRLIDFACRAQLERRVVLFIEIGDMSADQIVRRIGIRSTGRSDMKKYCGELTIPIKDCLLNQDGTCPKHKHPGIIAPGMIYLDRTVELGELYEKGKNHQVCQECRGCPNFKGSMWWKEIVVKDPCDAQDAWWAFDALPKHGANMLIHAYPNFGISPKGLHNVMVNLKEQRGIVPDVVIIDYADNMDTDSRQQEFRHREYDKWARLRAMAAEWNCLVITATQGPGKAYGKFRLEMSDYAEDKRKYAFPTLFMALNQMPEEKKLGILRINTLIRREGDCDPKRDACILQSLATGAPCLESFWV